MSQHSSAQRSNAGQSSAAPASAQFQPRPFAPIVEAPVQGNPEDLQAKEETKKKGLVHDLTRGIATPPGTEGNENGLFVSSTVPRQPEVINASNAEYLSRMFRHAGIQPKLTVGAVGDKYEQEADAVAARVVEQINSPPVQREGEEEELQMKLQRKPIIPILQKVEAPEEDELQMKIQRKPIVPVLQKMGKEGGAVPQTIEQQINSAKGSGNPLAPKLQTQMGQAMGADFSEVKIHTDSQADQLNQSIQAKAFTTGRDVFFRKGAYQPSSKGGQELIAHELTHVVQQNGGSVRRAIAPSPTSKTVLQREWVEDNGVQMWNKLIDGVTWFAKGEQVMWFHITDPAEIQQGRLEDYQLYEGQEKPLAEWRSLRTVSLQEVDTQNPETSLTQAQADSSNPKLKKVANPQSIQEVAEHATYNYHDWRLNDEVLLNILLGPFEANWFKAKACLTMEQWPASVPEDKRPDHSIGIKIMDALVNMRTNKWKAFTDRIKPEFTARMKMYGDQELRADVDSQETGKQNLQNIFDSVGAQAVTSDVDLASGGSNSELGVQFVNSKFRLEFVSGRVIPYDPGTVFDINLYASDWIHGEAGSEDSAGGVRTITPKPEVEGMAPEAEKERTRKMEVWSLVKIRRNMSPEEWSSYQEMTLGSLTDGAVRAEMQQKLLEAEFEYQTFRLRVETKQKAMESKLKAQEAAFFGGRESAFGHDNEEYQEDAHFTRAANAIYEETLAEVKILRLRINQLKAEEDGAVRNAEAISNLGIQLGDKIAEALTYANEVYATEGAVQHTVLKQGAGKKLAKLKEKPENAHLTGVDYNLKPELYLQSVNENVGDSLHSINHFKNVPHYAVYRAGKYLSRLCEAAELLLTKPGAMKSPFYEDLDLIGKNAMRVKSIKVGGIEGDPEYVKKDQFFKDYNNSNLSTVRAEIITFGSQIPQLFNEKKQREEAQQRQAQEASLAAEPQRAQERMPEQIGGGV